MYRDRVLQLGRKSQKGAMTDNKRTKRMLREFGKRLRASRIAVGYATAEDFAKDVGIEAARYRQYERGGAMPPIDLLDAFCQLTDKSSDFLLFGRGLAR